MILDMDRVYIPGTVSQLSDKFAAMASGAPDFTTVHGFPEPAAHVFAVARAAINRVKGLDPSIRAYLLARLDENWERLHAGEIRELKLSFGELAHFLGSRRYKQTRELRIDRSNATPLDL